MTSDRLVVAGADTHSQTHHVAVLDAATGQLLGDQQFPATQAGYRAILAFIHGMGRVLRFGVEGTNSYGAGLTRHLRAADVEVREVIRPNRAARRLRGKSDPLDAIAAAQIALAEEDLPVPKSSDGPVESLRVLARVRDSAVKARANVLRQIGMILVSAPAAQREKLHKLTEKALLDTLRHLRPGSPLDSVELATATALRHLARRHEHLTKEIDESTGELRALVEHINPGLLAAKGVGVVTATQLLITAGDNPDRITGKAAFAALTGVSPIPASSGKTNRHRLNRGGDRKANTAIHHRPGADQYGPAQQGLHRQEDSRGQDQTRSDPLPQTPHRQRALHAHHRTARRARHHRSASRTTSPRTIPANRRRPLRCLAHAHLHHRTR